MKYGEIWERWVVRVLDQTLHKRQWPRARIEKVVTDQVQSILTSACFQILVIHVRDYRLVLLKPFLFLVSSVLLSPDLKLFWYIFPHILPFFLLRRINSYQNLSDVNLIGSFFVLAMLSFMSSNDSENRSWWGGSEWVLPAASFLRNFPSIATQVTHLSGESPIIIYAVEKVSPIVFHQSSVSVHLKFPGFIFFKSENKRFF